MCIFSILKSNILCVVIFNYEIYLCTYNIIYPLILIFCIPFCYRISSYVINKVMARLFSSVVVHPSQIQMLRQAGKSNLPLIFLPLHRSHLDYIVITFILCNSNIRSPLVAAGGNLNIPVFG